MRWTVDQESKAMQALPVGVLHHTEWTELISFQWSILRKTPWLQRQQVNHLLPQCRDPECSQQESKAHSSALVCPKRLWKWWWWISITSTLSGSAPGLPPPHPPPAILPPPFYSFHIRSLGGYLSIRHGFVRLTVFREGRGGEGIM